MYILQGNKKYLSDLINLLVVPFVIYISLALWLILLQKHLEPEISCNLLEA